MLDWVPIESQVADGKIASPPPSYVPIRSAETQWKPEPVTLELDDAAAERGPDGTVPRVIPALSQLTRFMAQRNFSTKRGGLFVSQDRRRLIKQPADPDPANYFHNSVSQFGTFYGWDGFLNVWDPAINIPGGGNGEDHSILQVWLQNSEMVLQSLEGGLTTDHYLNGDNLPHIFTYYTTNGYSKDGDNVGGYNTMYKGWIQYSSPSTTGRTIFPGIAITAISAIGGTQFDLAMKFQLYKQPENGAFNWWVSVDGVWMGYYPAELFSQGQLGSSVTWIGAGGEVYSGLKNPEATLDEMGSGFQAAAGWAQAAYLRNLRNQSDIDGTMVDSDGSAAGDVAVPGGADPYTISLDMESGGDWGSFLFVGGPTSATSNLATWKTNNAPLPKGLWEGKEWGTQHSRASNDMPLVSADADNTAIRFVISGTTDDIGKISFNVAIDRSGGDKTCWKGLGNGSIVGLGVTLQQFHMTLEQANERGFYICEVAGATQPFDVIAQVAD